MRVPEEDPMHEAYWTYGDPGAPPWVKEYWLRPDHDSFPERWTDETETEERADWNPPYRWEPKTRTWVHYDETEQSAF